MRISRHVVRYQLAAVSHDMLVLKYAKATLSIMTQPNLSPAGGEKKREATPTHAFHFHFNDCSSSSAQNIKHNCIH